MSDPVSFWRDGCLRVFSSAPAVHDALGVLLHEPPSLRWSLLDRLQGCERGVRVDALPEAFSQHITWNVESGAEAWEVLETRGRLPPGTVGAPERRFARRCPHCRGMLISSRAQVLCASGSWPTRCGGLGWIPAEAPVSICDAVAFAAQGPRLVAAEQLAREALAWCYRATRRTLPAHLVPVVWHAAPSGWYLRGRRLYGGRWPRPNRANVFDLSPNVDVEIRELEPLIALEELGFVLDQHFGGALHLVAPSLEPCEHPL